MNRRDLNRAVARATGETVREIAERGFVLLTLGPVEQELHDADERESEHAALGIEHSRHGEPALIC